MCAPPVPQCTYVPVSVRLCVCAQDLGAGNTRRRRYSEPGRQRAHYGTCSGSEHRSPHVGSGGWPRLSRLAGRGPLISMMPTYTASQVATPPSPGFLSTSWLLRLLTPRPQTRGLSVLLRTLRAHQEFNCVMLKELTFRLLVNSVQCLFLPKINNVLSVFVLQSDL